jgi:hypothetical protein
VSAELQHHKVTQAIITRSILAQHSESRRFKRSTSRMVVHGSGKCEERNIAACTQCLGKQLESATPYPAFHKCSVTDKQVHIDRASGNFE